MALLTGSVLVIVGRVTVKLVVKIEVKPVLVRSKILFIGNVRVYVPGVRFALEVMVKILPLIVLVIGNVTSALFLRVIKL